MSLTFWENDNSSSFLGSRFVDNIFTRLFSNYYLLTMMAVLLIADMYLAKQQSTSGYYGDLAVSDELNKRDLLCVDWFQTVVNCNIEPGKEDDRFVSCIKSNSYHQLKAHRLIEGCFTSFGNEVGERLVQGFNRTLQLYVAKIVGINECWGSDLSACPVQP